MSEADKLLKVTALALFGDAGRTGDVYRELRTLCGPRALDSSSSARTAHTPPGLRSSTPTDSSTDSETTAQKVRVPEVTA
ncbi:hypothetical protein [Streptomyces lydicus]|uniref:hypothetical protein n=1 Tax=Streptomyces lydicus TaxID=47763 RepID=UPI0037A67540